jgi:hypothetical protein
MADRRAESTDRDRDDKSRDILVSNPNRVRL